MKKTVSIPTPQSLANAALSYLARFAASESALRRTLENRIRRAAHAHPAFAGDAKAQAALRAAIENIVTSHKKSGAINDAAFAAMKAGNLRRQGRSRRVIAQKLAQKGVDREIAREALAQADEDAGGDAELRAALAFARRRALGPFRKSGAADAERRRKDFAALARAGFTAAVARRVLGGRAEEEEFAEDA